jgi:hypothetical protein
MLTRVYNNIIFTMKTITLKEAAVLLKLHEEEVRRRAKLGLVPGAKPGKCWVFLEDDLVAWLRSQYRIPAASSPATGEDLSKWHSINAVEHGGSTTRFQQESALDVLLRHASKPRRNTSTTS